LNGVINWSPKGPETTPFRLQLGEDAVTLVRAHAESLLADLRTWETVAVDTRFESGAR